MDKLLIATEGNLEILANLIEKNGHDVNTTDAYGYTPLRCACKYGQEQACIYLLDKGASVDDCDIEGWTALHEAAFGGYEEIVSALLGAGATKTLRNKENMTALDISVRYGHASIAYALCEGHNATKGFY